MRQRKEAMVYYWLEPIGYFAVLFTCRTIAVVLHAARLGRRIFLALSSLVQSAAPGPFSLIYGQTLPPMALLRLGKVLIFIEVQTLPLLGCSECMRGSSIRGNCITKVGCII